MNGRVIEEAEMDRAVVRRRKVAASNAGTMRTEIDTGEKLDFEAEFTIDVRGRMGTRGVRQNFQTVRVQATVSTAASAEDLAEVIAETEARCPVYNLIKDAGIDLEVVWVRRDPTA